MIQIKSQVFLYLVKEGSKIKEVIIFFKEVAQLISAGHKHIIWLVVAVGSVQRMQYYTLQY